MKIDSLKLINESNLTKIEELQRNEERHNKEIQQFFEELRLLSKQSVSHSEIYNYLDVLGNHPESPSSNYYEIQAISGTSIHVARVGNSGTYFLLTRHL